ncbi:MAG: hypothetical protein AYL31_008370 [Candidatus Bathyarchaeota archaeon B26-1]|nr:MAG: hypothetical protein AYL31_008370 [Candidatus Bathyarchaeota archaeon B26-1]
MAVAWAKKIGTPYVEDPVFAENFHRDFSKKLGVDVKPEDVDYSEVLHFIEEERARKASLSRDERRRLAAERKARREANKEKYGYAWVDGVRMEVANYRVEPSSIFMGRGEHPLRGRWKEGPREEDIELNLSPDAPRPPGNWKAIVWRPNAMWIARWRDKLTGKMKYVWLSDSSVLKQRKEIEKFEKARELRQNLMRVKRHIWENLDAEDLKRRKTATVCFLIDALKIRVGDEKDPDEADTVGASTLRPEHIRFNGDGTVTFNFLGKDSVPHIFRVKLPDKVVRNLKEFVENAKSAIFEGVNSRRVSEFLDEVMSGLSAKVFRTCYASEAVEKTLKNFKVRREDPEYVKKYVAKMANLEAAKVCNHRRTIPKSWKASLERKMMRLKALKRRAKEVQERLNQRLEEKRTRYTETLKKRTERLEEMEKKLKSYQHMLLERKREGRPVKALKRRISLKRRAIKRQRASIRELKAKQAREMSKLRERLKKTRQRYRAAIEKLRLEIKAQRETRDYNLGTSLKSYIDPRIYYRWGKDVDYDWKRYYPKTLQKKFSWVESEEAVADL